MPNQQKKQTIANIVGWAPVRTMMGLAVRLIVRKQRIGVALVGFDRDGRILMLNHVFHPVARWGVPGGWLNKGEAPARCALRELEEETGLSAVLGPVVHVSQESIPPHIGIAYAAKIEPGQLELSSEIIDADWFASDELPEPILPFVRNSIEAAISYPMKGFAAMREWDE
jgi:ADP-ribose pyrophosphatase YjhB (NUDIX family)